MQMTFRWFGKEKDTVSSGADPSDPRRDRSGACLARPARRCAVDHGPSTGHV